MDRKAFSAVVLLFVAAMFSQRANPPSAGAAGKAPPGAPRILTAAGNGPWKPVCDHFRTEVSADSLGACLSLPEARGTTFRTIVATVPDPEQTHLALYFDRFIESIVWAVTDEGYSLESYWFPWHPISTKEATDAGTESDAKDDREKRLRNPGLLLFHKGNTELLAVFLVGERPTFGINRIAFRTAVEASDVLPKTAPGDETVYILGPSFSGSLAPLRSLIRSAPGWQLKNTHKPFFIVTGQATNKAALDGDPGDPKVCSTIENDTISLCGFSNYLAQRSQHPGNDVAMVTEDETTYGTVDPGDNAEDPARTKCFLNPKGRDSDDEVHFLQLRYPRGISRLRNNTEELPGLTAAQVPSAGFQELPLILKEPGEDTIPSFSSQQTPVSAESVLQNLATTLRRKHIRYAGIVATDPLDQLFLSRFLKTACPDMQLFILGSDLLFVRAAHQWGLEGVLSVTNYPLFLQNQDYMSDQHPPRRVAFSSGYAEGLYNAARRILLQWRPDATKDQSDPCRAANRQAKPARDLMLEYSSPFHDPASGNARTRRPSLWLTVVGRDNFWPVSLLPMPHSETQQLRTSLLEGPELDHPEKEFEVEKRSTFWDVSCVALCLLSAFIAGSIWWMNASHKTLPGRFACMRNFSFRHLESNAPERAAYLLVIVINALLVNLLFLAPAILVDRDTEAGFSIFFALVLLGEAIWMTIVIWRGRSGRGGVVSLAVISWGFFIPVLIFLIKLITPDAGFHAGYFFAYRSIHPESGLSPTAPLLLFAVAYYYWAWLQLKRSRLAEELGPKLPCVPELLSAPGVFLNEIEGIFGRRTIWAAAPLVAIWMALFNPLYWTRTFEHRTYDYLVMIALAVMYAMLIGNSVRFILLWSDLRVLLKLLERHPLRYAFSRLPHELSWTAIWSGKLEPFMRDLTRSRDCLRRFAPDHLIARISQSIETMERENRCGPAYFRSFQTLQTIYCAATRCLLDRILRKAWSDPQSDSIEERNRGRDLGPLAENDEQRWFASEFVVLQYVALIRYVLLQMRIFLEFVTFGFVLTFLAMVVYPFEAHAAINTANIVLFALLAIGAGVTFAQMSRDPLLSRLAGTQPGRLDLSFVWRVVSFGALPLLTLLGSEFPSIGNFLFSWVQPAVQAMK